METDTDMVRHYRTLVEYTCQIKRGFTTMGKEQAQDKRRQIDFYYSCIYDLLQQPMDFPELHIKLKYYKGKLIHFYRNHLQHIRAETRETTILDEEQISLYHIVVRHKDDKEGS